MHILCGITELIEHILEHRMLFTIGRYIFGTIIANSFYILGITCCIFCNRFSKGDDDVKCDNYKEAWLRYEINFMFAWIFSCAIFMLYCNLIGFESYVRKQQEKLNLQTLWQRKNSQDYLHYLKLEANSCNLIFAPMLLNIYELIWHNHDAGDISGINFPVSLVMFSGSRFFMLYGFIMVAGSNKAGKTFIIIIYGLFVSFYAAGSIFFNSNSE